MRFKSANCSSKAHAKRCIQPSLGAALALAATVCAGAPGLAHATVQVTPMGKGGRVPPPDNAIWYVGVDTANPLGSALLDGAAGFAAVDLRQSQVTEAASLANIIEFEFFSDKQVTAQTGQVAPTTVLMVSGLKTSGTADVPVAIASVGGVRCDVNLCRSAGIAQGDPANAAFNQWFYAVPYTPGQRIRIGLYVRDVCTSFFRNTAQSTDAQGCAALAEDAVYRTVVPGTAQALTLSFQLQTLDVNGNAGTQLVPPVVLPAAQDSGLVNLHFEKGTGRAALTCPSSAIPFFPGDQQIFVDTSAFSKELQVTPTGFAPMTAAIVVGKKSSADPDLTANFNANDVVARTDLGANAAARGFVNLTSADDAVNTYKVAFLARDAAGAVHVPTSAGCPVTGVQTSEIQGFLSKSNCFIATAAFRSVDSPPVAMLRDFRDRVLLAHDWGQEFVHWYYRWSPGAAEWLMMHSEFRYPVLQALIPVEVAAWFMTHPLHLTGLLVGISSGIAIGLAFRFLLRVRRKVSS